MNGQRLQRPFNRPFRDSARANKLIDVGSNSLGHPYSFGSKIGGGIEEGAKWAVS
jgi:hypothetical protein